MGCLFYRDNNRPLLRKTLMRFWLDPKPRKTQDLQSFPNRLSKSLSSFAGSPNKFGAKQIP